MVFTTRPYEQFLEWCRAHGGALGRRAWEIGTNTDRTNRTGHLMRGYLASVQFLHQNPNVANWIVSNPATVSEPFPASAVEFVAPWSAFLRSRRNRIDHAILHRILPRSLGGETVRGGGGGYPFKLAMRLAAQTIVAGFAIQPVKTIAPKYRMVRRREVFRDPLMLKELKALYDHRCQVCGGTINLGANRFYCEGHHLRPLGREHNGSDDESNIVILCPNHHAEFDYFLYAILDTVQQSARLEHMYRPLGTGESTLVLRHALAAENIDYVIEQFLTRLDLYFARKGSKA
jgi:hypothetical protein